MWQAMYLGMYFHWDVNADYDKIYEEINSLYYGRGWNGGMREFRRYLTELYRNAGGCWGYGHSTPVGKFLDVPGAKEKLLQLLDRAEKAAASDPDKRALAHVKLDRTFFERTWIKAYQDYISNYREIKAYPLQGKIVVDGRLDERDWKNADVITRFKRTDNGKAAKYQTAVKLSYDKNNIYIGIECLEPEVDKIKTTVKKHDGPVWEDNNVELFLNDPILGSTYFQILVNTAGVVCDGSVTPGQKGLAESFESGAETAVSFGKDRYFMEIRIPVKSITGGILSPGNVLRMNVMRGRVLNTGNTDDSEYSTWSSGTPHSVETFHSVTFSGPRAVSAGNRTEIDTRLWRNGSFNEIAPNPVSPKHWKVKAGKLPANWHLSSAAQYGGEMEYLLHPGSRDNYFIRLRKGFLFNELGIRSDKIRVSCRIRGRGGLRFGILRYKDGKFLATHFVHTEKTDSAEWKNANFEFVRPGGKTEQQSLILWPEENSEIDIDDLYPQPE